MREIRRLRHRLRQQELHRPHVKNPAREDELVVRTLHRLRPAQPHHLIPDLPQPILDPLRLAEAPHRAVAVLVVQPHRHVAEVRIHRHKLKASSDFRQLLSHPPPSNNSPLRHRQLLSYLLRHRFFAPLR